jgi:hypothetical protein
MKIGGLRPTKVKEFALEGTARRQLLGGWSWAYPVLKDDGLKVSWDDDIPKCFWKFIIRSCSSHDQIRESEKAKFHISGGH